MRFDCTQRHRRVIRSDRYVVRQLRERLTDGARFPQNARALIRWNEKKSRIPVDKGSRKSPAGGKIEFFEL